MKTEKHKEDSHESKKESSEKHIDKKDQQLEDLKQQLDETTGLMKRIQADFENYKKRVEVEKQQLVQYTTAKISQKILTIIDTFDIALKNTCNQEQFTKGVELIYSQLTEILINENIRPILAIDQIFDPHKHEVMMQIQIEDDKKHKDGQIIEEFQKGYIIGDKILRTSKVKIVKIKKVDNEDIKNDTPEDDKETLKD